MATFTVTTNADTTADDGQTSLREALVLAQASAGPDTITFASAMTITLTSTLQIAQDVTIDGDLDDNTFGDVSISGGDAFRLMDIISGTVRLDGLLLSHGREVGTTGETATAPLLPQRFSMPQT